MSKPHRELHNPHEWNPLPSEWGAGAVLAPEPNWRFLVRDNPFLPQGFEYKTIQPAVTILTDLSRPFESFHVKVTVDCILNVTCLWRATPLFSILINFTGQRWPSPDRDSIPRPPKYAAVVAVVIRLKVRTPVPSRRPILCPALSESCSVEGRYFTTKRCSGRGRNPHPRSHQHVTTLWKRLSNSLLRHWFLRTI